MRLTVFASAVLLTLGLPIATFAAGGGADPPRIEAATPAKPADPNFVQAKAMIERTGAGPLLKGYRGTPPADEAAVLAALLALGRLVHDCGDLIESIDINPLVALPQGEGAVALDALVVLRD